MARMKGKEVRVGGKRDKGFEYEICESSHGLREKKEE